MYQGVLVYAILVLLLFILINSYFYIARYFNITDVPNKRSSHKNVTLRGGGVIFYMALILYFLFSRFEYSYFFIGISLVALISFVDDIKPLPFYLRMGAQFVALMLMFQELSLFNDLEIWAIAGLSVVSVGIVNAYNFMDGINGITGLYSLVILGTLWGVNKWVASFVDGRLVAFIGVSMLVFLFYNLRPKARCFAGDVGSVSIAYIVIFLLFRLMLMEPGQFNAVYILFLSVYGVDTVATIMIRLLKRENIFIAHRSHLYQVMIHKGGMPHIKVSFIYAILQLIINILVISVADQSFVIRVMFSLILLLVLSFVYVAFRIKYLKRILA